MNDVAQDHHLAYARESDISLVSARVEFADVKAATLRSLDYIVPMLLPGGKKVSDEWVVRNPTRDDKKAGSFSVNMRTGVWSDFATTEAGGDVIDLYCYIHGVSNLQAMKALADMLNVQGRPGSSATTTTPTTKLIVTAAPADSRVAPLVFPPRTEPDAKGKPSFTIAGEDGPKPRNDEVRRHVYRQGGEPVRIKIIKVIKKESDHRAFNLYRVIDSSGKTGWQSAKPKNFQQIPYFVPSSDPFTAEIGRIIFWVEGEKDVETVAKLGGLAFTFGGTGDGLPEGCQQYLVGRNVVVLSDNDDKGRTHAEAKAALAKPVAVSVKVIHFPDVPEKGDVSDWIEAGHTFEDLKDRVLAAEAWKPTRTEPEKSMEPDKPSEPSRPPANIKLDDFQAFLPMHSYIYIPTRDLWPAVAVNSQLAPMPVINEDGSRAVAPATKDKDGDLQSGKPLSMSASAWLDKHQAVAQMTWAPGLPMLIRDRLISEGGWFDHPGATCFNLYRPPTLKHGDSMQAGPWLDHVKKVYPDDCEHLVMWFAYRVQHPEIKINHNIVLSGNPGVGKDTLLEPVVQAVGPWNCTEVAPEDLFGSFNGYLKSVILRVSEARDMGDVNKFQLFERMKTIGAAPPEVLRVNEKHLKEHSIVNVVGNIITSNYKTDGLYLPADDRRHYVAWSDLTQADFDSEPGAGDASLYFDKMWSWYEKEGGFSHVAAFLATADVSAFNPKAPPLKTPAFWAIVDANRPAEEAEIMDALDMLNNPPAITLACLMTGAAGDLSVFLHERKNRKVAGHRIIGAGYEVVRNDVPKDGLWVVKGARKTIYARKDLTVPERNKAAQRLAAGDMWCDGQWMDPVAAGQQLAAMRRAAG